jgi:hypothetical protein
VVISMTGARKRHDPDYCTAYHCAGDCGLPHNDKERQQQFTAAGRAQERKRYAAMVLGEFDKQERQRSAPIREERAEVRRKAKESL